jgi:hypothetical protein
MRSTSQSHNQEGTPQVPAFQVTREDTNFSLESCHWTITLNLEAKVIDSLAKETKTAPQYALKM